MSKFGKVFVCFIMAFAMILIQASCSGGFFVHDSSSASTGNSETTSESTVQNPSNESTIKADFNIDYSEVELEKSESAKVVEKIRPSVIEVHCVTKTGTSSGSGVILGFDDTDDDGENDVALVVTCHHVIEGATSMTAKSIFGDKFALTVVGSDPVSDIGILQMQKGDGDFSDLTYATMYTASDKLIVGSDVFAIGNPLGYLGGTVTKGVISALNRDVTVEDKKMTLIQTDAAINGGNSGGGLFDLGFNYKVGDTWKGMCKTCGHCSEDRTFTCVYSYAPGDGKYNYTWWRCGTCGAVWRWVPDSIWGGDWDKAYWNVADMKKKDPLVIESMRGK